MKLAIRCAAVALVAACAAPRPAAAEKATAEKATDKTVKLEHSGEARVGSMAPSFGLWGVNGDGPFVLERLRKTPSPAPMLITFGASWCAPCRTGLPRLKALAEKNPPLRLVLIDLDREAAEARTWLQELGWSAAALHDKFEVCARLYGAAANNKSSLPRTFLVDAKGRVRAIYSIEGADLEAVIEADLKAAVASPGLQVEPAAAKD
jgi:thiol-disulfide isomerase/thioredoxin